MNSHGNSLPFVVHWTGRLERFLMCAHVLGLRSALAVFLGRSQRKSTRTISLKENVNFTYRTADSGILTHFYMQGWPFIEATNVEGITRIVDAGANIGTETVRFLLLYPHASVVSVEVESENFALLKQNTAWAVDRVDCIEGALWHQSGASLSIQDPNAAKDSFQVGQAASAGEKAVTAFTLHDIMTRKSWEEIDILKIDIEGAEKEIFDNMDAETMGRVRCLVIEPHDVLVAGTMQSIFDALRPFKFRSFIVGECIVSIRGDLDWTWNKTALIG